MSEVIKTEDNSNDQHVIDDVYDGVEEDKNNEQTRAPVAEEATPAAPPKEEKKDDEDKATMEKVAAMSVMFPSIDKEIILSVLKSSSTQERAVETLLQMSDPSTQSQTQKPSRQFDDDEALARRLQEMDFERNGRASSTPYDDLGYEPRKPRRQQKPPPEQFENLEPGFNFSDITNAFSELATTSKKHLNDFWSSLTEGYNTVQNTAEEHLGEHRPAKRSTQIDDPYAHHYDPQIHRRAQKHNRQSIIQMKNNSTDKNTTHQTQPSDLSGLGFLPRREIDLSQHKRNTNTSENEEDDDYTHNPFNERK
ncbi:hypothetical protein E3Q23_02217 [Wallemia mellicola]|uniref:CUE domain-containing protein n=1 Tax=Wallemia mellicola TaxID=1708541 RepID=A0A4V6TQP2_9BASI|nr:hypothetical protein E3Q23_02217 [Wallemia mellicola]TIC05113.1 hypothetical protein E3Q16_02398 [Wallemia mellicola]TIC27299.1 hypothetical protein E3Q11_02477 [Wallemia mellicola]TIC65192.1 hypothetical protein E3Q01_02297 [Wallemia mellicola]